MSPDADRALLDRFRARLTARLGLTFDENRASALANLLAERATATRVTPEEYLERLGSADRELPELAKVLTIAETYFFRNAAQLEVCMQTAVPACLARRGTNSLRILSAACASGEEPYSLAILLRERWPSIAPQVVLLGSDVNPAVLERARLGRYSAWSLRETPAPYAQRYFSRDGADFVLDPAIRESVRFEAMNLVEPEAQQLAVASFDIVFCRNALMYFTSEQFTNVTRRLARAIVPGGYLFLGHAETLRGVSQEFHLCHTGEAFYYQKRNSEFDASESVQEPRRTAADSTAPLGANWLDVIQKSTDRVCALQSAAPERAPLELADARIAREHAQLRALLARERFTDALELLHTTAPSEDTDHALLRAVVAAQAGCFDEARATCQSILARDELNAGAQYVLALCHEHAGNAERAIYHDQLSSYLDPGFAMPRVHLGLLYKRRGDGAASGRELREARQLIEREDATRLLLFGGGFDRTALLALCDAELALHEEAG